MRAETRIMTDFETGSNGSASGRSPARARSLTGGQTRWLDHPGGVRPTVLVLGGFLTAPPMYRRFAERLRARGAAGVVVANVWTPDWVIASARGPGAIATRSARALLAAGEISAEASDGAPILVIGHSAGGLIARILTAGEPVCGRRFGAAARMGAIVTLGTPHILSRGAGIGDRLNRTIGSIADAAAPGACHSPSIGYVSVASRAVRADPAGNGRERVAQLLYRSVLGREAGPGT
jgi:triacylglycerol esterase/lipase EstA (alpha/beta hydrolase family)